jgi:DNA helicase II / ATP-dependent DNA helicase PcrA
VGRLAEVLAFVRDRGPLLDPPGDLRALWAYYQDMSDEDWSFRDETDRFAEATPGEDKPDEVTLLTGHKAKGLEFDTVFVLRAWPRHGFPNIDTRDEKDLPEGLIDRAGDTRDAESRRRAEERRLFYVACTRAERRLVILTKAQKERSSSLHFVHEMLRDSPPPPGTVVRTAAEVHEAAREAGVELSGQARLGGEGPTIADRRAVIEQERTRSRRSAAEALDALDRPGVTAPELDAAAARLRAAGARLALAAHLGSAAEAPAWHGAEGLSADAAGIAERLAKGGGGAGPVLPAMKPPLKLSFTKIMAYERCPRCFYLEHVYRIREAAAPGMVLGQVAHTALEKFYEAWRAAEADGKPTPGLKDLLVMGQREFFRALAPGQEAPPDLRQKLDGQLTLTFERLHNASDEIEEIELQIRFPYEHAGVAHEFEAKLDRLDRLPPPGGHLIIDYKTGQATDVKRTPEGDDLQLGIYALALRHHQGVALDDRATPATGAAEYWLLATGERGRIDLKDIKYDKIRAQIGKAIEGMLSGRFPRGKDCTGLCDILGPE